MQYYEPKGVRFIDAQMGEMLLCQGGSFDGWLCYRHPDGQWVALRKATKADMARIAELEAARAAVAEKMKGEENRNGN
jgi:hypothetical protein